MFDVYCSCFFSLLETGGQQICSKLVHTIMLMLGRAPNPCSAISRQQSTGQNDIFIKTCSVKKTDSEVDLCLCA
jgi:hypothetical protein